MITWLTANAADIVLVAVSIGVALLVVAVVLLVAWLRASQRVSGLGADRAGADRARLDAEMALAEQTNRLRIIRELHEVAAHSLSVVISQADGARYAAQRDPSAAGRSAAVIAETTRSTLADLRRVMSLVGEGESSGAQGARLDAAHELVDVLREQGLDVVVEEFGAAFPLKPGAEIAIYRILQEALANALAYGGPGTEARVTLTWSDQGLQLRVEDDGIRAQHRRAAESAGTAGSDAEARGPATSIDDDLAALTRTVDGRGIAEMRARAELYGGILTATTQPGVGFTLAVVFPALRHHNGVHGVDLRRS
ncbi:MAG: histidine kinase [Microcella sp.]|uniref:sensor histidine kinase n=1 Tax=Microcella sp. TaxID=1913979 RepID=UPI0027238AC8|nr:ATP-binding protein [Microcella sp.]MDO8337937.1 histidine kinase [Microcella sp.]